MSSDGNDFGEFDNEAAMEALSQVSCNLPTPLGLRPAKRRRLSPSDDDSIEDFIVHEDSDREANSRSRSRSRISADWDSDDEVLKPKSTRKRRSAAGSVKGEVIDTGASKEKKKSKYRIHIPRDHNLPEPQFEYATQVPDVLEDPDSSPYRIRGAQWKFKKPEKPPPQPQSAFSAKSTSVSRSINMPARNGSISNFFPRSANSGAAPKQNAEARDERSRYEPQIDNLIAKAEDDFPEWPPISRPIDISQELADLPSDAFSSSPETEVLDFHPIPNSTFALANPSQAQYHAQQRLVAPQNGLRQTTLFGGQATEAERPASQVNKVYNYLKDIGPEEPTHHELDLDALKTWVYPTNLGTIREYQYSIVSNGLFNNLLVALPTGLGKTFIAATIMLNYFRWTKSSQIVFMAPTKPLVAQQVDACFNIAGIPRSTTTLLTGEVTPAIRAEEWKTKRVFFMTPQTLENDLRRGYANPKRIVLLVVDEAHRATGNYSYVKVVSLMRSFSKSFRILALTATPGASVEAVQEVIDGLEIAKVEIRMEESIDIQQFVHTRNIEKLELEPSDEMVMIEDLLSKALQPLVNLLCGQNGYYNKDPMALTAYGMQKAQKAWFMSTAGRTANPGLKGMMMGLFSILSSVAHGIKLLKFHGIGPFYETMKEFRTAVEDKGAKGSKYKKQVTDSPDFQKMMDRIRVWINKEDFVGHPKLTILCESILNHFMDGGEGTQGASGSPSSTRVIVFCEYRDSAEEICRVLRRHKPMIRPSVFVGQQDSKRSQGMNQTKQSETIQNFKDGVFNVLVATSIGEEGLDIGQVDLIVCYDASGSPIRMLQRMGRTGRKRAGKIVLLVMKGKESDSFEKAKDNYEQMQKLICDGKRFNFHHDLSTRIVPRDVKPVVDKRVVEIPIENTQDGSLPEPRRKRAARGTKMPAKKFHVPDGVELGIVKASSLFGSSKKLENSAVKLNPELLPEQLMTPPEPSSVILSPHNQSELARVYQSVYGNGTFEVETPDLKLHPAAQRILRPVGFIKHGSRTKAFVRTMNSMHNMTLERTRTWQRTYEQNSIQSFPLLSPFSSPNPSQEGVAPDLEPELLRKRKPAKAKAKTTYKRVKINRSFSDGESVDKDEDNLSLYDDQEDDEDDLEGFLVKDTEIIQEHIPEDTLSSQTSTLPSPRNLIKLKPFFEPSTFIDTDESDSGDEELPDIGRLSSSASKPKSTSLSSVNAYNDGPKTITEKPRQRRRLVKRSAITHSSGVGG